MGRVKIPIKKIEDRQQRNIAFAKRKSGLLKKAYELYILCDVQIALVFFSPSGKLFLFDAQTRIEETIQRYLDLPCYRRGSLPDEPFIRRWIDDMRLQSKYSESSLSEDFDDGLRYQTGLKDIEEEIEECNIELANVEQQMGYFLKNPNQWESVDEINYQEKLLQKTLDDVRSRKEKPNLPYRQHSVVGRFCQKLAPKYFGPYEVMANLLNNRDVLKKARTEIDEKIGQDRLVDEEDIPELPYLQNVVSETFRLTPVSPVLVPREASEDIKIGGYDIPRGTIVLINAWAIHRDPKLWQNPEKFYPERFDGTEFKTDYSSGNIRTLMPFWNGRRLCPGAGLGQKTVQWSVGALVQCFDWERVNGEEIDMEETPGSVMRKRTPLRAMCRP